MESWQNQMECWLLNAFKWPNQDSAVDREIHLKSYFSRARFCKTLSERHLRALDEISFHWFKRKFDNTASLLPSLSPVSIYVTVLPPWELNTAEIFKVSNVAILNLFWSYPHDFTQILFEIKWSKYIVNWYMIKSN